MTHDAKRLEELRALPLERKIQISQARIIEWYNHYHGNVVVSFSGGKDSTVLLHLVRSIYPNVKAVFSNTGLEYPEIQKHVKTFDNVDIVTPSMRFDRVISVYGYPLIGKEVAEAIYYARRIRSHSLNVERERERAVQPGTRERKCTVTERLHGGGGTRPTESVHESASHQTDSSSHRDKHCEEQTNRSERQNGGGRTAGDRRSAVRSRQTRTSTDNEEPG